LEQHAAGQKGVGRELTAAARSCMFSEAIRQSKKQFRQIFSFGYFAAVFKGSAQLITSISISCQKIPHTYLQPRLGDPSQWPAILHSRGLKTVTAILDWTNY
jgi:hypothetical protein